MATFEVNISPAAGARVSEEVSFATRGIASTDAGDDSSFFHLVFESVSDNAVLDQFNIQIKENYKNIKGEPCRLAEVKFPVGAKLEAIHVKACKDENGFWKTRKLEEIETR